MSQPSAAWRRSSAATRASAARTAGSAHPRRAASATRAAMVSPTHPSRKVSTASVLVEAGVPPALGEGGAAAGREAGAHGGGGGIDPGSVAAEAGDDGDAIAAERPALLRHHPMDEREGREGARRGDDDGVREDALGTVTRRGREAAAPIFEEHLRVARGRGRGGAAGDPVGTAARAPARGEASAVEIDPGADDPHAARAVEEGQGMGRGGESSTPGVDQGARHVTSRAARP